MKYLIIVLSVILTSVNSFSQVITFQKRFTWLSNQDGEWNVLKKLNSGYLFTCTTLGVFGQEDIMLLKTDNNCNIILNNVYGGSSFDRVNDIQQTQDGGFVFVGNTSSFGPSGPDFLSFCIIKTDVNGAIQFSKVYGGTATDNAEAVQQTNDKGYIIAGNTMSYGLGVSDIYIVKTDSTGIVEWANAYGTIYIEGACSIFKSDSTGYIVIGSTYKDSLSEDADFFIMKIDTAGNPIWAHIYGGYSTETANSAIQTSDGGYAIVGQTRSFGTGFSDVYLVKLNSNGIIQWSKNYGGSGADRANDVLQTSDYGYIISGETNSFGFGGIDNYMIKTDSIGNVIWSHAIGGTNDEFYEKISQCNDGGFLNTSTSFSFASGNSDLYIVKTDSLGHSGCNEVSVMTLSGNPITISDTVSFQVTSGVIQDTCIFSVAQRMTTVDTLCMNITVTIEENLEIDNLIIFPNPVTDYININKSNIEKVELFNSQGLLYSVKTNCNNYCQIDMKGYSNGIYILKIMADNKQFVKKVIKE